MTTEHKISSRKQKSSGSIKKNRQYSPLIAALYFFGYNTLGVILSKQRKYREAEQAYRRAIEIKPDYGPAYYNLGILLNEREKFEYEYKREKSEDIDKLDIPALICAAIAGYDDAIIVLLNEGDNVHATDNEGRTALIWASACGHTKIVKSLLNSGASVNAIDKYGATPLIYASENGHIETVRLLLDKGANVNAADKYGATAHSLAGLRNHADVVNLLHDRGANTTVNRGGYSLPSEGEDNPASQERKMILDETREIDLDKSYLEQTFVHIYPYVIESRRELFEDKFARAKGKLKDALQEVASIPFPERKEIIKELLINLEPLKGELPPPLPDPDLTGNTYPLYIKRTDPFKHLEEVWGPWLVRFTPSLKHNYLDQRQLRERDPVLLKALSNRISRNREQVRDFIPPYNSPLP